MNTNLLNALIEAEASDTNLSEALSRKYYVAIAAILRPYAAKAEVKAITEALADMFALDNRSFDRDRFLTAAGQ